MNQKHDIQVLAKSLTGFDEIAIEKAFSLSFSDLGGTLIARALLFVVFRREGKNDPTAYLDAMNVAVGELEDYFETPQDESLGDRIAQTLEGTEGSGEA